MTPNGMMGNPMAAMAAMGMGGDGGMGNPMAAMAAMGNPMAAMAAMSGMGGGGMMGGGDGMAGDNPEAADMNAQMMNMAMASMLSASAGGDMGMGMSPMGMSPMGMGPMGMGPGMGMPGDEFDTAKLDNNGVGGSLSGAGGGGSFSSVASQPAQMMQMMQMAQMAQMAAAVASAGGADPSDPSNPAAAQAMMMQQMVQSQMMAMAAGGGGGLGMPDGSTMDPNDPASSKRDSVVTNSFTPNQSFQQHQFQKQMKTMMTNMQIAKTVATSDTLKNLTDDQVQEISEKKFSTAKEFMNFMQSAGTEVGNCINKKCHVFTFNIYYDMRYIIILIYRYFHLMKYGIEVM